MIFKVVHVALFASVKYFFTLPYAMLIGLDYNQAIITVLTGGIGGFLFFYYMSKPFLRALERLRPFICLHVPDFIKTRYQMFCQKKLTKKSVRAFTKRRRFLVKFRSTYGFWGIIIATPFILTIPLGAFLANKYYSKRKHTVPYMIISFLGWAVVLTGIVHIFPKVFF